MQTTITDIVYLDMLEQFLIKQLDEGDLAAVRECLSTRFPRLVDW
jgi:hypothetical protein